MSKLLIDDYPLMVLPKLAVAIGLPESIFVQQLHWLCERSQNSRDGCQWVYNTVEEWQEKVMPFLSESTVRRVIKKCEEIGIVISTAKYNRAKFDKTKWFRVNYEHEALNPASAQNENTSDENDDASAQNEQTECSNWTDGSAQIEQIEAPNLSDTIPQTIHRLSTDSHHQHGDDDSKSVLPEKQETVQTETEQEANKRVELCKALRKKGLLGVNPQHPAVHELAKEFSVSEALFITDELITRQKHSQFSPAYVLTALRNARDSPKREYGNQQQSPKKPNNPSTQAGYHEDLDGWGDAGVKTL